MAHLGNYVRFQPFPRFQILYRGLLQTRLAKWQIQSTTFATLPFSHPVNSFFRSGLSLLRTGISLDNPTETHTKKTSLSNFFFLLFLHFDLLWRNYGTHGTWEIWVHSRSGGRCGIDIHDATQKGRMHGTLPSMETDILGSWSGSQATGMTGRRAKCLQNPGLPAPGLGIREGFCRKRAPRKKRARPDGKRKWARRLQPAGNRFMTMA